MLLVRFMFSKQCSLWAGHYARCWVDKTDVYPAHCGGSLSYKCCFMAGGGGGDGMSPSRDAVSSWGATGGPAVSDRASVIWKPWSQ